MSSPAEPGEQRAGARTVTIDRRFCGPPRSGNGGYTAGRLAAVHPQGADRPVAVTLRQPPPLDVALTVEPGDVSVLRHGDELVAEAAGGELAADVVPPVPAARAREAEPKYAGLIEHPFPTCFTCGPDRDPADGLRLLPGLLSDGRTACTWTPHASLAADAAAQLVDPVYVWAALDCPGAWTVDLSGRPLVLGRITARVDAPVEVGTQYVVMGRLLGSEGRKMLSATAIYDPDQEVVARAEHVWIAVDAETFGA